MSPSPGIGLSLKNKIHITESDFESFTRTTPQVEGEEDEVSSSEGDSTGEYKDDKDDTATEEASYSLVSSKSTSYATIRDGAVVIRRYRSLRIVAPATITWHLSWIYTTSRSATATCMSASPLGIECNCITGGSRRCEWQDALAV